MYGTRDAGLIEAGWMQGMACPNIYVNEDLHVTAVCHEDDVHLAEKRTAWTRSKQSWRNGSRLKSEHPSDSRRGTVDVRLS